MLVLLRVDELRPNDYNPNVFTAEQMAELVQELQHLGHPAKPIVVRLRDSGFEIVDGEHNWRAAREIGLATVACQVIEADEFEARRQTLKRNQHGAFDPVALGQMLLWMMEAHGLSQRELAKTICVSEATIRNNIVYAEAARLRNSCAGPGSAVSDCPLPIKNLTVRQVRAYVALPAPIRDLWLDAGADLKALDRAALVQISEDGEDRMVCFNDPGAEIDGWKELATSGLAGRITSDSFVASAHEAFRLWSFRREFVNDIVDLDAYLSPVVELKLPSSCMANLPCRVGDEGASVLVSAEEWRTLLTDCSSRAGDSLKEIDGLLRSSLRLALRRRGVESDIVNDPRYLEARHLVDKAPVFIRESALAFSDQYALAVLFARGGSSDEAVEALRRACLMLEEAESQGRGGEPSLPGHKALQRSSWPEAAYEAALASLQHEKVLAERRTLLSTRSRLVEALVERLCASGNGAADEQADRTGLRTLMAERIGRIPLPELGLLGAPILGWECGLEVWQEGLKSEGA